MTTLPDTADVSLLPNLGERSARMLREAGVRTVGDLRALGAVEAYRRVQIASARPSIVLLWAMAAGLRGEHWQSVGPDEKAALRARLTDE